MKKNILTFLTIVFGTVCLLSPNAVSAQTTGKSGDNNQDPNAPCSGSDCPDVGTYYSAYGIRISFVDADGQQVAGVPSFNFMTKAAENLPFNVNSAPFAGKTQYSFQQGSITMKTYPGFGKFAQAFDQLAAQLGSPTRSMISGEYSGGTKEDGWSREKVFIGKITDEVNAYAALDIEAMIEALASVAGIPFDKEALKLAIEEGCHGGKAIFFITEPMITLYSKTSGTRVLYFGTVADLGYMLQQAGVPDVVKRLDKMSMYYFYPDYDPEPIFHGAIPVPNQRGWITTISDAYTKQNVGFGMLLNWATDEENGCVSCEFTADGFFSFDNVIYKPGVPLPNGFSSVQQYALTDRSKGGAGCCELLGEKIKEKGGEWASAYEQYCEMLAEDSCPDKIKEPALNGYNNCCDETISEIKETPIEELFCQDSCVEGFKKKKFSEKYYKDPNALADNDFCDMYCTERILVEIPGPISAKSGRYFELTTTSKGSSGPYMEGYRRCRVRIEFDEWYKEYIGTVTKEVNAYNAFQSDYAHYLMYDDASGHDDHPSESVSFTTECSYSCHDPLTGRNYSDHKTGTPPISSFVCDYTAWEFTKRDFFNIKTIDKEITEYTKLDMIKKDVTRAQHQQYSADQALADCIQKRQDNSGSVGTCPSASSNCSLDGPTTTPNPAQFVYEARDTKIPEEVPEVRDDYLAKSEQDNRDYKQATQDAQILEEKLDQCDFWFANDISETANEYVEKPYWGDQVKAPIVDNVPGEDPEHAKDNFDFEPDASFRYSQVYLSDAGTLEAAIIGINFVKNCKYSIKAAVKGESSEDIYPEHFDTCKYKTGKMSMRDMQDNHDLVHTQDTEPFDSNPKHEDEGFAPYQASKKYTTDAVYEAVCDWKDKNNDVYTLAHSGLASKSNEVNYTEHGEEYAILLTTLDGTYETYWDVAGMGHQGRMDKYFEGSSSCAGEDKTESAIFTCKIHTVHTIVYTGTCDPVTTEKNKEEKCHIADSDFKLFNFKVADPNPDDFFPSGTNTSEGEIAKNWFKESAGMAVASEMKNTANQDLTFSKEHLSYVFNLDPQAMRVIKRFNTEKENNGDSGYGDFDLDCQCPANKISSLGENNQACVQCRSKFLKNLSENKVLIDRNYYTLNNVWQGKDIEAVRSENYGW